MSEAVEVNGSLTVLGRCIRAVAMGEAHVPWRDAVLCQLLRSSFEGTKTHTQVVVNVSPEYEDETACTLKFGETVACVRNRPAVVVGRDTESEIGLLQGEVQRLRTKKRAMEESGQGSGFVEGCIHSERLSLQANMDKLAAIQTRVSDLKARLVEKPGTGTGTGSRIRIHAMKMKTPLQEEAGDPRLALEKEEYNLRMLVLRQQSIKKLWRDATPLYISVVAELGEKENQLRMVTGE